MIDDAEHLRRYATSGAEDAFAAIVQRYLPLVYGAALRRVGGDVHRAQDVAQLAFTALARNAAALARHPDIAGWLFTTTRFLAAKVLRGERRRQAREQAASVADEVMTDDSARADPASLHAVLDDAMMELRQLDRQVILLRFHRGLRLAEIGAQLGATENAVQKRLDRALDRLREKLGGRGITSTATALAVAFEQQGAVAMPAGLTAAATAAGLAGGVGAGSLFGISGLVTVSKLQLGLAAAAVAATVSGLVWTARANARLRAEIAGQEAAAHASVTALTARLATLAERASAAEADGEKMRRALQAAAVNRAPAPPARVLTDSRAQTTAAMARGSKLAQEGQFQEALDEYLKRYRELAGVASSPDQQLIMGAIRGLGPQYPPALTALRGLRDAAMEKLRNHPASTRELAGEISFLNARLGENQATVALYDLLPPGDPGRSWPALVAYKSFVEAHRYADALVGKTFGSMLEQLENGIRAAAQANVPNAQGQREFVIETALTDIEVLTGAGKKTEAQTLTAKLLEFDRSAATQAALQRRLERAGQPPAP